MNANQQNAISRASRFQHPIQMIRELQEMGTENWNHADNPLLRPFAWLWQGAKVLKDSQGLLLQGYVEGQRREAMFAALGIKQEKKGLVYYQDGKYSLKEDGKRGK